MPRTPSNDPTSSFLSVATPSSTASRYAAGGKSRGNRPGDREGRRGRRTHCRYPVGRAAMTANTCWPRTPSRDVAGKRVRIIRGSSRAGTAGRRIAARGAHGGLLCPCTNAGCPPSVPETLADLEARWRQGLINVMTSHERAVPGTISPNCCLPGVPAAARTRRHW